MRAPPTTLDKTVEPSDRHMAETLDALFACRLVALQPENCRLGA